MRRTLTAMLLALALTAAGTLSVLAAPPSGGCPPGGRWILEKAEYFGPILAGTDPDLNGDGLLCGFEAPLGGGIFTVVDNTVKATRAGGTCAPPFGEYDLPGLLVAFPQLEIAFGYDAMEYVVNSVDLNGNGEICAAGHPAGSASPVDKSLLVNLVDDNVRH